MVVERWEGVRAEGSPKRLFRTEKVAVQTNARAEKGKVSKADSMCWRTPRDLNVVFFLFFTNGFCDNIPFIHLNH